MPKPTTEQPDGPAYSIDDRGNVADCSHRLPDGTRERAGRLDREAGPSPCNQLAWHNWFADLALDAYMRSEGYGDELDEAARNAAAEDEG